MPKIGELFHFSRKNPQIFARAGRIQGVHIPHSRGAGLLPGAGGVVVLSPDALVVKIFSGGDFALAAGRGFALATACGVAARFLSVLLPRRRTKMKLSQTCAVRRAGLADGGAE